MLQGANFFPARRESGRRALLQWCCCSAGKTLTAPLDRVKLLLQTRGGLQAGALKEAARGGGVIGALAAIGKEEGFLGYWKGNIPQVRWPCF